MLRIILAGCGGISRMWLSCVKGRDDAEIVAMVDSSPQNAQRLREEFALDCRVYASLETALHSEPAADILWDLTPPAAHKEVVIKALRHGLHVFGEKPISESVTDALEMVQAAEAAGKRYFIMQNRRYLHGIQTLRRVLDKQMVGRPTHVSVDLFLGYHFTGFRNTMEHPLILDMAIHTFDEIRFVLGEAKALTAYCQEYNPAQSWYRGAAGADCIFQMEDGVAVSFRGSWASHSENTSSNGKWRVSCTEGTVVWDGYEQVYVNRAGKLPPDRGDFYEEEGAREDIPLIHTGREGHGGCLDDMFACLLEKMPMQTECGSNVHSLKMVEACIQSADTQCKVSIS